MHNNPFFKSLFLIAVTFVFFSCDKDYSSVGDNLIGENNFDLVKYSSNVLAYNEKITPLQSNNLPVNALGICDNPAFGKTTASFVTQLTLATVAPTFTTITAAPAIDSVHLSVPYFIDASKTTPITTGGNTYVLDSIYGEPKAKIKLSVYESGRYMGNQIGTAQKFYTNQNTEFETHKILYQGNRLNDDVNKSQNDEFFFDPSQHIETTTDAAAKKTNAYIAPEMRLKLNANFFVSKIFNAPASSLATNIDFMGYFKGLYFKVEQSGTDKGSLAMINFTKGKITIYYKEDKKTKEDDPATTTIDETVIERVQKTLVLNMSGNAASLLEETNPNTDYDTSTKNPDRNFGDPKLYLKGGEGSLAVIQLFGSDLYGADGTTGSPNGVSDELDKMRKEGWLINQANLVFNIDTEKMGKLDLTTNKPASEPDRIYLYDYTNNVTIADYYLSLSTTTKKTSKFGYGGFIERDATTEKRGVSYKINITNHIRDLVQNVEATNVKLGVVVTEDINSPDMFELQTTSANITKAPKASVMNPLGTILYGNNLPSTDANYDKRLQLEIHYTKPK